MCSSVWVVSSGGGHPKVRHHRQGMLGERRRNKDYSRYGRQPPMWCTVSAEDVWSGGDAIAQERCHKGKERDRVVRPSRTSCMTMSKRQTKTLSTQGSP
jgi:hypothetical protein